MAAINNHLQFVANNEFYATAFGEKGQLAMPPAKKLIIVTCIDARLKPESFLGLAEGDAHIIRNAGGVAQDALRSIVISQRLLGTREIAVFHHTGCGMTLFSSEQLRGIVSNETPAAAELVKDTDFMEFGEKGVEGSIKADVKFLKESPLVLDDTVITGWVYETETGKVRQIV
ncbi:carbonic anhydrase [Flagelloscypha sp. PMI_526]|nr:carbonic anhydrase [Flagelloscypha sp. PMI_526]